MPSHSPFDINQLPVELVEEIITHVKSSRELYNLCLVCKQFQGWAKPQLYESVFLSTAEQIVTFSSTISRTPELGCKVRDLWMFLSIKRHEDPPAIVPEEEDDDDDSEWTPEDIEDDDSWSGTGSTSDESDSESDSQDEYSETEELDVPVYGPFDYGALPLQLLEYPHEPTSWSCSSAIVPSRDPDIRRHVGPDSKVWRDCLIPVLTFESFVYGHAIAILGACPSLRCLYLPWSGGCSNMLLCSLLPSTRLQELAIYRASDLRLNYNTFQPASILMDLSTVQRLTILDTTFQKLPTELPKVFPVLSHLRISLNVSADMVTSLSQFPNLTHLWFAPPQGDWHPQVDIEAFLLELQTNCPRIRRVRVDIPLGSTDAPQSFGVANWELFPFVRVRGSMIRDTKSMWVYDLEYPFHEHPPEGVAPDMYNAYAECLKYYWRLRMKGGGWDG